MIHHDAFRAPPKPRSGLGALLMLAAFVGLCLATGFLGSLVTTPNLDPWHASLVKPAFNPPDWLFGPVWTALFLMMAFAAWLVWRAPVADRLKRPPLMMFLAHLPVNFGWSVAFFGFQQPLAGLVVVVVLFAMVVAIGLRFARLVPLAGLLFVPYALWVGFASVLNGAIWWLNR